MSEVVQGALIGIIGAIVGAGITSFIAYINNQAQLKYRIYELKTDRLIKTREQVLVQLREIINQSLAYSNRQITLMVQMGEANKKDNKDDLRMAIKRWEEADAKSDEVEFNLGVLVGQISDSVLMKLIEEVKECQKIENQKRIEVTVLAHQRENWTIENMNKLNREFEEVHKITLGKLVPVNKRIEELLSGEPSKQ